MLSPFFVILISVLVSTVIGAIWYSPLLFGELWRTAMQLPKPVTREQKIKGLRAMLGNFLATFLTMIGMVGLIQFAKSDAVCPLMLGINCTPPPLGALSGAWIGVGLWFFFIVPTVLQGVFFEQKSWRVTCINLGYRLVELVAAGAVIGALI